MSSIVRVIPEAEADVNYASAWYNYQRQGLGKDFFLVVSAAIRFIARNPLAQQVIHQNVRRKPLRRFPYAIYYIYEAGEIIVFAVLHQKRHPSIWKKRRP